MHESHNLDDPKPDKNERELLALHAQFIAAHQRFLDQVKKAPESPPIPEPSAQTRTQFDLRTGDGILLTLVVGFFAIIVWIGLNPGKEVDILRDQRNQLEDRMNREIRRISSELQTTRKAFEEQTSALVQTQHALRSTENELLEAQSAIAQQKQASNRTEAVNANLILTSELSPRKGTVEPIDERVALSRQWSSVRDGSAALARAIVANRAALAEAQKALAKVIADGTELREALNRAKAIDNLSSELQERFLRWSQSANELAPIPEELPVPTELEQTESSELEPSVAELKEKLQIGTAFMLKGQAQLKELQRSLETIQDAIVEQQSYIRLFTATAPSSR